MKLLLAILITLPVCADTTAVLHLKGTVPVVMSLELESESLALNLPLDVSQNNTKIGTIKEKSNSGAGYTLSISSLNNGYLKNGTESVQYTMNYGGVSVPLNTPQTLNRTTRGSSNRDVNITYTGAALETLKSGDFTDTVTFTIQAN
jgi:hypothetical protein